jgi:hypothetical protein
MATDLPSPETVSPAHGDLVRVVPLYIPDELKEAAHGAPAAAPPHLVYNNGPLLDAVQVFTVFWGAAWEQSPLSDLVQNVNGFFDFILTSPLLDQLAEYNTPTQTIGHGTRIGTATITTPQLHRSASDGAIQKMLEREIASNSAFPQPTANTLYFVYLPPGVVVVQGGGRSCQSFCGYHDDINGQIFYAVMPYPGCGGCTGNLAVLDALTSTSSHELCEAITDAIPGQGWYDESNGEIGDICAWKTKQVGNYTVQQEWSNKANACV